MDNYLHFRRKSLTLYFVELAAMLMPMIFVSTVAIGQVVYSNDFETDDVTGWSTRVTDPTFQSQLQIETTKISTVRFLGRFGSQAVDLKKIDIPEHDSVTVEFDLFIIQTWDGNVIGQNGPDIWSLGVIGGPMLLYTSFSNRDSNRQSYPDMYPYGDHPAMFGASSKKGVDLTLNDVDYHIKLTFPHTASELELSFVAELRDQLRSTANEAWGIDNVKLTAVHTTPSFSLQVNEYWAEPGDTILMPVYMRDIIALHKSGVTGIQTNLRFNASLLYPIGATPIGRIDGQDRVMPLVVSVGSSVDSVVAILQFLVLLGMDSVTTLTLEGSSTMGGYASVHEISGRFSLKGGCKGSPSRSVVQQKLIALKSLNVSSISNSLEVLGVAEESGWVEVSAFDHNGCTVIMPTRSDVSIGEWRQSFDMQALVSGLYFVVVETPSEHRTFNFAIVR